MPLGFYIIMAAQFFSALADNALLIIAIEMLKKSGESGFEPLLKSFFAISYVVLAAWVGAFADSMPKGRVMFVSNAVKIVGCLMFFAGAHPLYAYAVIGLGAAAYSPAKYGILTELLPHSKLVVANGWIEGLTVAAIILGTVFGGEMVGDRVLNWFIGLDAPLLGEFGFGGGILIIGGFYMLAALFNLGIPNTGVDHKPLHSNPLYLLHDFLHCLKTLWRDKLGQISLALTTVTWGVAHALQIVVINWAPMALEKVNNTTQATRLMVWVAAGMATGAVAASILVSLRQSIRVIPLGIVMGATMLIMPLVDNYYVAVTLLLLIGACGGFFVVPMNALLQHRGHVLLGAGHSIAVQNFNENLATLMIGGAYFLLNIMELGINAIIVILGLFVITSMSAIKAWHEANQRVHDNVAQLDNVH
ncbi:MAG: lysophospholipid transporter LplT [Azoarcus sp.]|jgi:hypothetical protein|nr:lysophospholipid transporter LplT [Azoarcus sp.]